MGVSDLVATSRTAHAVLRALKSRTRLRQARHAAQDELQNIYYHMRQHLGLPALTVRLPLRKKFRLGGIADHSPGFWEIRIYPIRVSPLAASSNQRAEDIFTYGPAMVSEILLHEIAHIHEAWFTGDSGHEESFVRSYCIVEQALLERGFGHLLGRCVRFVGCPVGSAAAALRGTPRPRVRTAAGWLCVS
jgi:hypothetical protein